MSPELHDATLLSVTVDWPARSAALRFRRHEGPVTLVVSFLTRLELPRAEPWGPSSSVSSVDRAGGDGAPVRFSLEMQSGDVLVVEGAYAEWVGSERAP